MSKRHSSNDKRPRPHALAPREHYVKKNGSWKPKLAFPTEPSARNWLISRGFHLEEITIYECTVCHKYHFSTKPKNDVD